MLEAVVASKFEFFGMYEAAVLPFFAEFRMYEAALLTKLYIFECTKRLCFQTCKISNVCTALFLIVATTFQMYEMNLLFLMFILMCIKR